MSTGSPAAPAESDSTSRGDAAASMADLKAGEAAPAAASMAELEAGEAAAAGAVDADSAAAAGAVDADFAAVVEATGKSLPSLNSPLSRTSSWSACVQSPASLMTTIR